MQNRYQCIITCFPFAENALLLLKNIEFLLKCDIFCHWSEERKLWETLGFAIAEIIVAVTIMTALVAVLMKDLQSSVKSVRRDIYRSEVRKRLEIVVNKVEIALLSGKIPNTNLSNIGLTEEEQKDLLG